MAIKNTNEQKPIKTTRVANKVLNYNACLTFIVMNNHERYKIFRLITQ